MRLSTLEFANASSHTVVQFSSCVANKPLRHTAITIEDVGIARLRSTLSTVAHLFTNVVGRQRLRSATQQLMVVPRHRLSTVGRRAFAVHGPMVWNSLPDNLRAQQDYESFRQGLKTWLFFR